MADNSLVDKRELRLAMRKLNRSLQPEVRSHLSHKLWEAVESLPQFREAKVVAFFSSLSDEPDTSSALECWSQQKHLLVPRVEGEIMHFYEFVPEHMTDGSFGILEPSEGDIFPAGDIDLIVVPGVAFTAAGDRMGRGKGFYDKYLSQSEMRAYRVGVCYPHQIVESLPTEPHDQRMDIVVSVIE